MLFLSQKLKLLMKNKRIFCITSYCDTPEKIEVLTENILKLKKYNYSILLHSYLKVPNHISSLVDYLIIVNLVY